MSEISEQTKIVRKFRKKPVTIEAVEWKGELTDEISNFIKGASHFEGPGKVLCLHTLEGVMTVSIGDFIIRGVAGEVYPCKPDIFWKTYEEINE